MKKIIFLILIIVCVGLPAHAETYLLDSGKSVIQWTARKLTGKHTGTIKLEKGEIILDGETISGGYFVIEMKSITVLDRMNSFSKGILTRDLKSKHFFSVKKFPFSKFVITEVKDKGENKKEITGNLTIKGITNPITFLATVEQSNGLIQAEGTLTLDRTKWGIRYRSGQFFKDLGVGKKDF